MKVPIASSLARSTAVPRVVSARPSLSALSWKYSLLLPIALLALIATFAVQRAAGPDTLRVTVRDAVTGQSLPGAQVRIGDQTWTASDQGIVELPAPETAAELVISAPEYRNIQGSFHGDTALDQTLSLQPTTLRGTVTDDASGAPIADATVTLLDASGAEIQTGVTGSDGTFAFRDVPSDARVQVDAGDQGTAEGKVGEGMTLALEVKQTRAIGRVLSAEGEPIQGAIIVSGSSQTVSKGDGTYRLENVADGAEVQISASGYESVTTTVADGKVADASLTKQMIKAIYANYGILGDPNGLDQLIEIADTTEINAIVVDIKQDTIYYDTQVPFFIDAGTVNPVYDVGELLARLEEHDIYAIARLVVFQDPLVAEARPDLAVMNEDTGDLWRNEMGVAWVNAFEEELWDANIALATEAIGLGFAEIQYDYVRFPSDGDLGPADFGREYTAEARETAITEFIKRSSEAIHEAGGKLAVDLFGYVTLMDDEQWIGQKFSKIEPHVDYICMMIYPSHFAEGNIASAPGHPNDYPYETIMESLERAEANVPGSKAKFRPWLQDFSYGFNGLRDYEPEDVRAQIDAAEEFGTSGWMLWGDPFNVTVEALEPETDTARTGQAA